MHKVYIGSDNQTHTIDTETENKIVEKFTASFESFTYHRATGIFRGTKEDTLVVSLANVELEELKSVVSELCSELNQEAIGIEANGEYIRVTR